MKNLKIAHQLLCMVAVLMAAFATVTYYQVQTSITAIYQERYDMLRTQVESGLSILELYHSKEKAGELSREEAQRQAYATAEAIKFEPAGYLWAFDSDITVRFHYNRKLVGTNFKGQPDKKGSLFREDMLEKARDGGGITLYYWEKPGEPAGELFEKATYSRFFEPWQIVVATGVYTDDLEAEISETIQEVAAAWLIAFLLALAAAFIVMRNITKPLAAVHAALQAVADEEVETAIPHTALSNEVGTMAKATQALREKIRERHALAEREERQRLELDRERQQNYALQEKDAASQARVVSAIGEALEKLCFGVEY
jgi:methyl-accepting chemotaxis protein